MRPLKFLSISALLSVQLLAIAQPVSAQMRQGTTAGGGGTGTNEKLFESYIRDPRDLPAYQLIKPIFDNIDRQQDALKSDGDNDAPKISEHFGIKLWYFVPSALKGISKDTLGVYFLKNSTQQVARQHERSIWVDNRIFQKMTKEDQAILILHEFVMQTYFIKYKNLSEICEQFKRIETPERSSCKNWSPRYDEILPPVAPNPLRPEESLLNKDDNENIRFMTNWLLKNGATSSLKAIYLAFSSNGFDRRMFNSRNVEKRSEDDSVKMIRKDFIDALERARVAGRLPRVCQAEGSKEFIPCQVSYTMEQAIPNGLIAPMTRLNFEVKTEKGQILGRSTLFINEQDNMSPFRAWGDSNIYSSVQTEIFSDLKLGRPYTNMVFYWEKRRTGSGAGDLELVGMTFSPGVLTQVLDTKETGFTCRGESPKYPGAPKKVLALASLETNPRDFNISMIFDMSTLVGCFKSMTNQ